MLIDLYTEIKILTGATMANMGDPKKPENGNPLKEQVKVLNAFLVSHVNFTSLTVNEIRHAFYLNSQGEYGEVYRHWNKELNAEFMGDVLLAYLKYKRALHDKHGTAIKAALGRKDNTVVISKPTVEDVKMIIQQHYDMYRKGELDFIYLHDCVYRFLRKVGGIPSYTKGGYLKMMGAAASERERIGQRSLVGRGPAEVTEIKYLERIYDEYMVKGFLPADEYLMVIHVMRKTRYMRFFRNMEFFGVDKIFKEISI